MSEADFFRRLNIEPKAVRPEHLEAAAVLQNIRVLFERQTEMHFDRLSRLPLWTPLNLAVERLADLAEGTVAATLVNGAVGEVSARTILEASINLAYIVDQETLLADRLYAYLCHYIKRKRQQVDTVRKYGKQLEDRHARFVYSDAANAKVRVLDAILESLKVRFRHTGVDVDQPQEWPRKIGHLINSVCSGMDYDAVYRNLCSHSHHDASELLIRLVADDNDPIGNVRLRASSMLDSWVSVTFSLRYYLLAVKKYAKALRMDTSVLESIEWNVEALAAKAAVALSEFSDGSLDSEARRALDDFESWLVEAVEYSGFPSKEENADRVCKSCGEVYQISAAKKHIPSWFDRPYYYRRDCGDICLLCFLCPDFHSDIDQS